MGRMRGKKGVLYTISVLLMASAFLYLLAAISSHTNAIKSSAAPLTELETLNAQFDSASYGIKAIITHESANITMIGTNISFEENLSISGAPSYYSDIPRFAQFVGFYGRVNNTINVSDARRPVFNITPQNIEVDHTPRKITFTPLDSDESAGNVTGYDLLAEVTLDTPTLNWTSIDELDKTDSDAMYFHLGLQGANGTITTTRYINKYNSSELGLVDEYGQTVLAVSIESPAAITINYNSDIHLKIIIGLTTRASVELGENIVTINTDSIQKTGKVTMDES